ncbi:uncharacterized protein LODBEIA_P56160 [Lodderomyces beijingensis]|uniref:GSKIP domain-containing protein n=1 Tax=Lodderomyces beijingensis TaxID=1775926 RepID=A0ABP0ZVB2_9ASCO
MERSQRIQELTTIRAEYSSFFPAVRIVTHEPLEVDMLEIETVEGEKFKISVDVGGWYAMGLKSRHYETFEALMQSISPAFTLGFGNALTDKLNQHLANLDR